MMFARIHNPVDKVLVVGATGQLGMATVKRLASLQIPVRALVRDSEGAARFRDLGIESTTGDLKDPASIDRACEGVTAIVATANAAIPTRPGDTFQSVDLLGYQNLIQSAVAARVRRFVYMSAPLSRHTQASPLLQCKRAIEDRLAASGLDQVIFRADIFMDTAFPMMGSAIPLRNSDAATVLRKFGFANRYFARIKNSIEDKKLALVPGTGKTRHAFICIDDVASFLAAAVSGPAGIYRLGGPQALTFLEVVRLYEQIVGTSLRVRKTPAAIFRAASSLLRPFSPAGANLMALNYIAATEETLPDETAANAFGVALTTAETFLRIKNQRAMTAKA